MTIVLDRLIDWLLVTANFILYNLSPYFRSRTGWENPRVRNITSLIYLLRGTWILNSNLEKWRESRAELFPVVLHVQTINRCNGKCGMCPYPYTVHLEPREIMDDALYSKIIHECAMEADFRELVPMVQSGLDTITISLSAFSEETFNKLIAGLSWKQITGNLEAVAKSPLLSQINVFLRYVRQRGNESEFSPFKRYWQGRGINVSNYEINNRAGALQDYEERIPYKSFFFQRARKGMGRRLFKGACPHAFGIMHILKNGDVPLCANDWEHREKLGNVREQSIRQIYNSPRMLEIRELMEQGRFEEI